MLEKSLQGARLLYAYTMYIDAPLDMTFNLTGNPYNWDRDFDGDRLPGLALTWEGKPNKPGSTMILSHLRTDGTPTPVNAVRMELIHFVTNEEITFRFSSNHLIYRFVYEPTTPTRTEFTVNVLVDAQSPTLNTLRQRIYARRRRKASITDHMKVKRVLEQKANPKSGYKYLERD
ncbi:MAG: hypothetical protein ABIQ44_00120 [Chloroflexia bacterium]